MTEELVKKPIQLRIIFILNALMMFLPFVFYYVFTSKNISVGDLDPSWMIYTGVAYIASFIVLVFSILNRKLKLFRTLFVINFLIALPASAYIGMIVALVSMALSFQKKVLAFFASTGKMGL